MRKEEIYLNVTNISDNEFKNIISLLPKLDDCNSNSYDIQMNYCYLHVDYNGDWFVDKYEEVKWKIEVNYEQFLSLFEPQLKIGDTFEYNGFICRVESEVEKWVYDTELKGYYKTDFKDPRLVEITNKEFIKQLEENAR